MPVAILNRDERRAASSSDGATAQRPRLTRGCSGPGRVRNRRGRGIVETYEGCAAAEPPSRWTALPNRGMRWPSQ